MDEQERLKILKDFGSRLREIRNANDISQENLAYQCRLDRSYIGQVERGERNISLVNIYKIASGLNISPQQLLMPVGSKIIDSKGNQCT